jgi:hypothetical protein
LGQRETAKSQGEGLFIGMETSLQDAQYDVVHVEAINSVEFEAEDKLDLDNSLPLKKRKKWLRAAVGDENTGLQVRSVPLQSFPSFPLWPMISIAELEAFGNLQHRASFPSFPSRPMISIAELETRAAFGELGQRALPPCISGCHHYCDENYFCDESFFSGDDGIGRRKCDDFFEENVTAVENTTFPAHKVGDSLERLGRSETSSACASSQLGDSDMPYDKVFGRGKPSSAETSSVCCDAAQDSKADIKLFFGPTTNYLSTVVKDCGDIMRPCEGTHRPATGVYVADTDCEDNTGLEVPVKGSKCNIGELQRIVVSRSITGADSESSTGLGEEIETRVESKCIKVEESCNDRIENCALNCGAVSDVTYREASAVDATCEDLKSSAELQGRDEEIATFRAISVETKDNVEWCKEIDVPLKGSTCTVDVQPRDIDCM